MCHYFFYPWPVSRFPVGPVPGYRTCRKEHALSIVRDEFRPAIPRRVARQHCPPPLHRHHQNKTIAASKEMIYHRTANSLLTVCLTPGASAVGLHRLSIVRKSALLRRHCQNLFVSQPFAVLVSDSPTSLGNKSVVAIVDPGLFRVILSLRIDPPPKWPSTESASSSLWMRSAVASRCPHTEALPFHCLWRR